MRFKVPAGVLATVALAARCGGSSTQTSGGTSVPAARKAIIACLMKKGGVSSKITDHGTGGMVTFQGTDKWASFSLVTMTLDNQPPVVVGSGYASTGDEEAAAAKACTMPFQG